jgi:hypothetical protein
MRLVTASTFATFAVLFPCKLHALDLAPGSDRPLRQTLRQVAEPDAPQAATASPEENCAAMAAAATTNDLPVIFFLRVIWHESRFDPFAISRAGALGVAQFMPKVANAIGLSDPFDPAKALPASARFLSALHQKFGNLGLAAAAYNAGARRIRDWLARRGKLPPETRDYVTKVTGKAPEAWVKAALGEVELEMPPAPCRTPKSLIIPAGSIPFPMRRPPDMAGSDVSAAAKSAPAKSAPAKSAINKSAGKFSSVRKKPAIAAAASRGHRKHSARGG